MKPFPQNLQSKDFCPSEVALGFIRSLQGEFTPVSPTSSIRLPPGPLRSPCNKDDLLSTLLLALHLFWNQHAGFQVHTGVVEEGGGKKIQKLKTLSPNLTELQHNYHFSSRTRQKKKKSLYKKKIKRNKTTLPPDVTKSELTWAALHAYS